MAFLRIRERLNAAPCISSRLRMFSRPRMNPPHGSRLVHVIEASFRQLAAYLLEPLATVASHTPPVFVRPRLLLRFAFACPVAAATVRFGNITPHLTIMQI